MCRHLLTAAVIWILFTACSACAAEAMTASEITKEQFIVAVDAVARYARVNKYTYGDSRTEIPTMDRKISCDRLIARALWDLGFRDQQVGGITVGSMIPYLRAHGFVESADHNDIGYGSIVIVRSGSTSYWSHTFVTVSYDPSARRSTKYDCGTQSRINSVQPFVNEPWYYQNDVVVFNIPEATHVTSVKLDTTDAVMLPGQKLTLGAAIAPESALNKKLQWSSSDPSVASVNTNGTVATLAPGKTTITAVSEESGVKDSCELEVLTVPVTKVKLNKTQKILSAGHSFRLLASVVPSDATDKTVVFSSDNPKVATVSKYGAVKGLKSGMARITVQAGSREAVCTVTVKYIPVQSVAIRKKLTLKVGRSYRLKKKILPLNASDKSVSWRSSKKAVVRVDQEGKVTALRRGTAVITVKSKSGKRKARCVVTVK